MSLVLAARAIGDQHDGSQCGDTLDIELADRVSSSSEAESDNLIVDFDEQGNPVGVTLEHDSQISDTNTIETLLPITPVLQPA